MPQINANDYVVFHFGSSEQTRRAKRSIPPVAYVYRTKPNEIRLTLTAAWAVHFYRVAKEVTSQEVSSAGWSASKRPHSYEGTRKTALLRVSRHKTKPYDFVFVLTPFTKVSKDYPKSEYVLIQEIPVHRTLAAHVPGLFTLFPNPDPKKLTEYKDPVKFQSPVHVLVENNGTVAFYANEWDWHWAKRKDGRNTDEDTPEFEEPMLENLPPLG